MQPAVRHPVTPVWRVSPHAQGGLFSAAILAVGADARDGERAGDRSPAPLRAAGQSRSAKDAPLKAMAVPPIAEISMVSKMTPPKSGVLSAPSRS